MAIIDARGHTIAVEFDFVDPLRPGRRLLDRLGELRSDEECKRDASARWSGLDGLGA